MTNFAGEFWVDGCPRIMGCLDLKDDASFSLKVNDFIVMPEQVTQIDGGFEYSDDPKEIVADYWPRTIHGELEDGTLLSLLSAHMEPGSTWGFHLQEFTGQKYIVGAHIADDFEAIKGIRWIWNVGQDAFGEPGSSEAVNGSISGILSLWAPGGQIGSRQGLEFTTQEPAPLRNLLQYVQASCNQLIGLCDGRHRVPRVVLTEIQVGDKWFRYETPKSGDERQIYTTLLPLKELSVKTFAYWIPYARNIDPFPYMANAELPNLQVGAQMLVTALEGIHRRLYAAEKPFVGVSAGAVQRAMRKAREAGVQALTEEGFTDAELADKRLRDSLNFVNQQTYFDRVYRLATDVTEIAPGLCGPDISEWVTRIKIIRNQQSHQLVEEFQEIHISEYHMAVLTARWVISLTILFKVVGRERLRTALRESDDFLFLLANVDAERLWEGYSALNTFRRAGKGNGGVDGSLAMP